MLSFDFHSFSSRDLTGHTLHPPAGVWAGRYLRVGGVAGPRHHVLVQQGGAAGRLVHRTQVHHQQLCGAAATTIITITSSHL